MSRLTGRLLFAAAAVTAGLTGATPALAADEVNVYSYRQPALIDPLFAAFTKDTGIKVNVVPADKGLIERLRQEGANSPADLLLSVGIDQVVDAVDAGVTQPLKSAVLEKRIPANLRDPQGHWFALTLRGRIVYAGKTAPEANAVRTYEELADPKFKGKICTRPGSHPYQIGLLSAFIAHHGEARAEQWLRGLKANLAQKAGGNDRSQVKVVMESKCALSLGNTYYYGYMLAEHEQKAWAEAVNPIFPTLGGAGTHVNISGISLTKAAPHKADAVRLLEYMVSDEAQRLYAEKNNEYPVVQGVELSDILKKMGTFKPDAIDLARVASYRGAAVQLNNKVGYDE
ncbi:MAG: extracellular solute-binding protein [Alphaproteobacteria bacterium]|nr:extracellular solute-binding protein [Alphaproteobacteria bacterium]